ncbi:hypothetical protein V7F83_08490 [Cutibacterium avidum]|uniref:hypothetical protein n=1 Tax=Cutibacterium avidum TaxID=33010 RepID=UPI001F4D898E|nr:hypothetical protein [Cutibacterium avidum]
MDLVALILPVLGWITGAWERSFASRGDPAKIEHGIKVIGAAMMTTIGIMTAATFYTLIASQDSLHVPSRAAYSAKAFILSFFLWWCFLVLDGRSGVCEQIISMILDGSFLR